MRNLTLTVFTIALCCPTVGHSAEPSTQPASASVFVSLFAPLADAESTGWISVAIQQNLINELGRNPSVHVIPAKPNSGKPSWDFVRVRAMATEANANIAILGTYHSPSGDLRITGQVMDVATGRILGALKATGPFRDLFALEDQIAHQANRLLEKHLATPPIPSQGQAPVAQAPVRGPITAARPWDTDDDYLDWVVRRRITNEDDYDWDRWDYRDDYYPRYHRRFYFYYPYVYPYPAVCFPRYHRDGGQRSGGINTSFGDSRDGGFIAGRVRLGH